MLSPNTYYRAFKCELGQDVGHSSLISGRILMNHPLTLDRVFVIYSIGMTSIMGRAGANANIKQKRCQLWALALKKSGDLKNQKAGVYQN
ncbi:hypothetical protein ACET3Z_007118 [Daucus carota]